MPRYLKDERPFWGGVDIHMLLVRKSPKRFNLARIRRDIGPHVVLI